MESKVMTRQDALACIRRQLLSMQTEGKSACRIAAEHDILCRGFLRDSDDELRWRYVDRIDGALVLTREELEERANAWQLEQQQREGTLLCCDLQSRFHETCRGWDDFSNEELSRFCLKLCGELVVVTE